MLYYLDLELVLQINSFVYICFRYRAPVTLNPTVTKNLKAPEGDFANKVIAICIDSDID